MLTRLLARRSFAALSMLLPLAAGCARSTEPSVDAPPALNSTEHPTEQRVDVPEDLNPTWLAGRRDAQLATASSITAFHGFQFADRIADTGITFEHRFTDDSGNSFKPMHYDHGTGLAVADVDGDGLSDVYFVTQVGTNELWRNLGGGKFENISASAGVGVPDKIGVAASFADIDNDGDADLYTTTVRRGNVLFENDGKGHFTDISAGSGVDYVGHSSGAVFFDYDRDGRLDLFLANVGVYTDDTLRTSAPPLRGGPVSPGELEFYNGLKDAFAGQLKPERTELSRLFHNEGGNRFKDVTDEMGLVADGWSGDASVVDANNDGWPDLYVLNMQGDDAYFENQQGTKFVDRSRAVFPNVPYGSMGIKVFDFDNDGKLDIYVVDMHSDMNRVAEPSQEKLKSNLLVPEALRGGPAATIIGNAFFKNEGNGQYKEVSDAIGAETFWPWGLSVADLNADGFEDAFITAGMGYMFRYGINSLLLNEAGERFVDSEFILGVEPRRDAGFAQPSFTLDCSGADKTHSDCTGQTGTITVWGALSSRSSAMFDWDGDGDLDIMTNEFNGRPMAMISNLSEVKPAVHYLKLRLIGTKSNRSGIGAVVRVHAGGKMVVGVNDGKSGYLSQSVLPLYFGLGEADSVERIEIDWPSGTKQVVDGPVAVNTLMDIEETE